MKNENVSACKVVDIEENRENVLSAYIVRSIDCHIPENEFIAKLHEDIKRTLKVYQLPKYYKL